MDSNEALLHALKISEIAINSSSSVASWIGIAVGVLSLLFAVGVIFLGIRYFKDAKMVEEKVKVAVDLAVIGMQYKFDKRYEEEKEIFRKELDPIRKEIATIWLRNVVTSENKDLHAIYKALESALSVEIPNHILAMIQELHSLAMKHPHIVGGYYWELLKFEALFERVKVFLTKDPDYLKMSTVYITEIETISMENKKNKESAKRKENT